MLAIWLLKDLEKLRFKDLKGQIHPALFLLNSKRFLYSDQSRIASHLTVITWQEGILDREPKFKNGGLRFPMLTGEVWNAIGQIHFRRAQKMLQSLAERLSKVI